MSDWVKPLEGFKGRCDPFLIDLVQKHNDHFQIMEEMTPQAILYDDKENPNKLYDQMKELYDFFTKSKWTLERYRTKKFEKLNIFEDQLVKYLESFYIEFYPAYELQLIGSIDSMRAKLGLESEKRRVQSGDPAR